MPSRDDGPLTGRLLVATPDLADPNFAHAVVLLLEHAEEGAMGLVVNRPRGIEVGALLPAWESLAAPPPVLFHGGPVQSDEAVVALGRGRETSQPITNEVGVVDLEQGPEAQPDLEAVRLFTGYAGWGGGQLEEELDAGSWFVVPCEAGDALTEDPAGLWRRVLLRQGGVFTTVPEDPTAN